MILVCAAVGAQRMSNPQKPWCYQLFSAGGVRGEYPCCSLQRHHAVLPVIVARFNKQL